MLLRKKKRRIANEEAQAKADKTALEAQEAANNAAKAAALAAEAAPLQQQQPGGQWPELHNLMS